MKWPILNFLPPLHGIPNTVKWPLFLLIFLGTTGNAWADIEQLVRCREIAFSQSVEARDAIRFASFIESDARFVGSSVTRGSNNIVEAWSAFFTAHGPAIKWRPQFVEVLADRSLALTRGPYRMITKDDQGMETEHWGTFNSIWRLQHGGDWKIVFDAGSASTESPPDEVRAVLEQDSACD